MDVRPTSGEAWWLEPPAADAAGLAQEEAAARLARSGPNVLHGRNARPLVVQLLVRFRNPLVLILLGASAISAFTGDITNFAIIAAIVLFSVTLDFVQEHQAGRAAERLREAVAVRATVVRDGRRRDIPVAEVVPGEIVLLAAGDLVPADGVVLEARDFFVRQALLTGEPYPVEKRPDRPPPTATELHEAGNAVFAGTSVVSGSARVQIVKTGNSTTIGEIGLSLARPPPPTSFELGTRRFGMMIMRITLMIVLFVLLVNAMFHRPWLESFLFAVALAVGLTPELLPMVVSVTLSRGALRMAKKRVIVKQLAAIQNLGSMDVLCTDKTGTLTEARIRLERHVDAHGQPSRRVLELAYLNSFFETGLRSPLDEAILEHESIDVGGWTKIDEVPFDFERRRVSVLLDNGTRRLLVVKGAPDDIVAQCALCEEPDSQSPCAADAVVRKRLRERYQSLEEEGFRVLGIAWREVPRDQAQAIVGDESELVLAGFATFLDPPKADAGAALQALEASGVAIKIVSGDSERVTQHICAQLGIPVLGVLTGAQIAQMDDPALRASVASVNLYCRVNPSQKDRVILALKARGHVVGYLGDGINDAPPLHSADVGLSVDTAVDVAKAAADIILLDRDLQVVHDGVKEGRRTFANVMKYILMGTSSNFGNMFSMAGASLFLPFLPMLPRQILLNNMLYDISELPIPLDDVDAEDVRVPRVLEMNLIRNFMLIMGLISSLFDFLTFWLLLAVLDAGEVLFRTGWFVESLCTQVLVIFVIRTRGRCWRSVPHPLLAATSLAVVITGAVLPFTPLAALFGFVPLPPIFYIMLLVLAIAYLLLVEVAKGRFYAWLARRPGAAP